MQQDKLEIKDLINIGLFTAIFFVLITPVGIAGIVPIIMFFLPALIALIGSVPIMLLVAKTQKFGALSLCGIIVSLVLFIMGHPGFALITGIPLPILADLIMKIGKYQHWLSLSLGYIVFSFWSLGSLLPFYFTRQSYFSYLQEKRGSDYIYVLEKLFTLQTLPIIVISCAISALLGILIAKLLFKKHFVRAGIV